ncbi:cupin domain-containing protein [Haloglomus salinum]|jgi:quercetin dioxygenase-like cupin family protein|uniref:cupin domain-containing protein n=1 Tax=Haloglomus salinum TaxID=2962673 RepID=UPI0020C9EBB4|nr:cupin domain-containing protein [Haloglomus salinum]
MTTTTGLDAVRRTGRPLDEHGAPREGPVLELDPESEAAALLRDAPRPLASNPGAGTWGVLLSRPDEGETEAPELLQWLGPDAGQPPVHRHPAPERFEVLRGRLTVVRDGEEHRLDSGDAVTVRPGVEHAFRNDTDGVVAFRAELPSMRTVLSLYTTWGLDHEGAFAADGGFGEPGPLHGLVLSEDVYDDTTMTAAPVALQRLLWATAGRVARALGYTGIDESYLDDAFWRRHVEQPVLEEQC